MPDKFLRLFGVVSSFPVGLHQDANPFNDFQRRQLYWKSTKNTLYLTETLQYCRKTIDLGTEEIWVPVSTLPLQNYSFSFSKSFNLIRPQYSQQQNNRGQMT